jgi:hypothetical protein
VFSFFPLFQEETHILATVPIGVVTVVTMVAREKTITSPVVVVRVSDRAVKSIVVDSGDLCGANNLEVIIDALLAACRASAGPDDD